MKKTYQLTLEHPTSETHPLHLVLTSPSQRGYCFRCQLSKEIKVISQRPLGLAWDIKEFCYTCALINLTELEHGEYEFENKSTIIKEIRKTLLKNPSSDKEDKELLECYE